MIENFNDAVSSLNRQQYIDKPSKLISNAAGDLKSALEHGNLTEQDYTQLNDMIVDISSNIKSQLEQLKQIHKLSDEINLKEIENTQENIYTKITDSVDSDNLAAFFISSNVASLLP